MKTYKFPSCNCTIPVDETLPDVHGHPSLIYPSEVTDLPLDCSMTWEMLGAGATKGVFQLESPLGRQWTKKLKPENIEHLAALGALLRPGCLRVRDEEGISMTEHYCLRKNGVEPIKYFHPSLEPLLNNTYGVLTYQEQAMAIAVALAGFTPMEADDLRKCVTDDTMFVSKRRGWVSIRTLLDTGYDHEEFLVMDRTGRQQWKQIRKIWSTGKHAVSQVMSDSGFGIWATRYHQFDTSEGWKARCRLREGDNLIACRQIDYDGHDAISSDMALVVAGVVCEGYFVEKQSTFVNHDIEMMERFVVAYEAVFGRTPSLHDEQKVAYIAKEERDKLSSLINYGLSDSRRLPDVMMGMSKESTARFLSYVLACEGGMSQTGQFEFSSKSYELAKQVKLLLLRFGIRSLLLSYPESERYRLYINDQIDQHKLLQYLTREWSNYKRSQLSKLLHAKSIANYTTDTFPSHIVVKMIDQYPHVTNGEGGSIYTQPISRQRFARLAEKTGDSEWIQLSTSHHCYDSVANLDAKKRQIETYDFTVDDDTPFIVANGLVIHNSIGKKKTDVMAKVKTIFTKKAGALGIVTPEEATEIFGWIEKSQRYSFNKCISFDTRIMRPNGGPFGNRNGDTVEEMYAVRNNPEYAYSKGRMSLHKKWKRLGHYGYGLSMCEDGRIRPNIIRDIKPAGFQTVYRIKMDNGAYIRVTNKHKFPTPIGIKTTARLTVGDRLYIKGDYEPSDFAKINRFSDVTNEMRTGNDKVVNGVTGEANWAFTNGSYTKYVAFKKSTPNICFICGATKDDKRIECHHINGDRTNSEPENLQKLCVNCHKTQQYKLGRTRKGEKGYPKVQAEIISIEEDGECMTFDVTMDAPNHNFVTSEGIVTCNSHAVSYALIGYHTAHAKAHFPLQFFTSYLYHAKEKQDPLLEIRQLVNDAKTFGIEVLPPDFDRLKYHFSTDGVVITFGLSDVKGIGDAKIPKLRENAKAIQQKLGIPRVEWGWYDFLVHFSPACTSTVVKRMIEVGAMRKHRMDRQRMLAEYDAYSALTEKEQHMISRFTSGEWEEGFLIREPVKITNIADAIEMLLDTPKGVATKSRREKVASILDLLKSPPTSLVDTPQWVAKTEEACLGIPITCSQIDTAAAAKANTTCQEFREGKDGDHMTFAVDVEECRDVRIQNGDNRGKYMAFLVIRDETGHLEDVCIFPEAWEKYGNIISPGYSLGFRGRRDPRRGSLIIEEAWKI